MLRGPTREVEVDESGFEKVCVDLVHIGQRSDDMCAYMAFIVEGFQSSPYPRPTVRFQLRFRGRVVVGVDPLFYFDGTGAVVHFVGDVCGLGGYVAYLADEGDLGYFDVVDLEFGVWVRLVCV